MRVDARGLTQWIERLRQALSRIQQFPESGRPHQARGVPIARSVLVEPYRLVYVGGPSDDEILIIDLVHVRRGGPPPHLDLLK